MAKHDKITAADLAGTIGSRETRDISFVVPCIPVAQPRQRHRVVNTGVQSFVQNYTPAKHPVQTFKAAAMMAASQATNGCQLQGPLQLWVTFIMPRPKSMIWKKRNMPRAWDTRKKDIDNLYKSFADALTASGIWQDDSQVVWLNAQKIIASGDEQPHVAVRICAVSGIEIKET